MQEDQLGPQGSGVVRALRPNQGTALESQAFPWLEPEPVLREDVIFSYPTTLQGGIAT